MKKETLLKISYDLVSHITKFLKKVFIFLEKSFESHIGNQWEAGR